MEAISKNAEIIMDRYFKMMFENICESMLYHKNAWNNGDIPFTQFYKGNINKGYFMNYDLSREDESAELYKIENVQPCWDKALNLAKRYIKFYIKLNPKEEFIRYNLKYGTKIGSAYITGIEFENSGLFSPLGYFSDSSSRTTWNIDINEFEDYEKIIKCLEINVQTFKEIN